MKFLLLLAVLCGAAWYLMTRAQRNAAVQQVQNAPVVYTKALQNDVNRAKAAGDEASKMIQQTGREVEKTLDSVER